MKTQQRRELQKRDREQCRGRQDFPESLAMPHNDYNPVALYGVLWLDGSTGRVTGNSWTSKRKAVAIRDSKLADGTFFGTRTSYCAGFAF